MNKNINICLSCDDKYSKYAGVVIASILANANENDNLSFYILDGEISKKNKAKLNSLKSIKDCEIIFVKINNEDFDIYAQIKTHTYVTIQTYYRLKLASLLPNVDRIIYLDCDMVINKSLAELYNVELEGNYIAGVLDARVKHKKKWKNTKYINAGMVLFDLKKIREDNIEDIFLQYTESNINVIKTGDQDIINFSLKNKIKIISDIWNVQVSGFASRTSYTKHPAIIHYIGSDKPWVFASNTFFKDLYFQYLQLTPWALSEKEKIKWYKENKLASRTKFWKKRPFCILNPKYWYVFWVSYVLK